MEVFLETERLALRRFTPADLDNLCDLDRDPEVMRFLNGGTPTPRHVIEQEILPRFLRCYERFAGLGYWAAIEKSTGAFLRWFSFHPKDEDSPHQVELGYRLRRAAWGKGYATEAARALIRKGFVDLGVQRVVASTYEANIASRRVMEKAGLTLVRKFRMTLEDFLAGGTYQPTSLDLFDGDDVEYALDRADWQRQEAAAARRAGGPGSDRAAGS